MECFCCENKLDEEEAEWPRKNDDNDIICDHCYTDEYQYTCPLCESYVDIDENENYIIILKELAETQKNIKSGIYEVIKRPYYSDSILGDDFRFFEDSIVFKKLLPKLNGENFISGFICQSCYKKKSFTKT